MLKQNIRALSRNLNKVTQYHTFFDSTPQLSQFHNHLLSLHENIKQYLRQGCFPNITILTEDSSAQSLCKSANIASNSNIYNQQQLDDNSFIIREPLSVLETGAIKFPEKGRVKLGGSSRMDKNFQDLMENIRLIILYQNKIEKLINPINNQSSMADVCLQQKSFSFEGSQIQNKENEHQPFDINNVKEDILRIIEDCKNIQQVQGNFEVIQGTGQAYSNQSQSENNDKKSLLTSMLLENQVMESDLGNSPTVKKTGRKPISQSNYKVEINKRLLKQFDFENYRIEQKGKRQRKADIKGCGGQCSQCTIF